MSALWEHQLIQSGCKKHWADRHTGVSPSNSLLPSTVHKKWGKEEKVRQDIHSNHQKLEGSMKWAEGKKNAEQPWKIHNISHLGHEADLHSSVSRKTRHTIFQSAERTGYMLLFWGPFLSLVQNNYSWVEIWVKIVFEKAWLNSSMVQPNIVVLLMRDWPNDPLTFEGSAANRHKLVTKKQLRSLWQTEVRFICSRTPNFMVQSIR